MRRKITGILICLLLISTLWIRSASANSWGLSGKLLQAVMKDNTWDHYTLSGNEDGPFAVLSSKYHNALFYVDNRSNLHIYTTAVYQPDDKRKAPHLEWDGLYLTISYGDNEYYIFCDDEDGNFFLSQAVIDGFYLDAVPGDYGENWYFETSDLDEVADWPVRITLSDFNISLFPRSVEDIRTWNLMHAQLKSSLQCLGSSSGTNTSYSPDQRGRLLQLNRKGTAPVYSSPYGKSAWRAGNGKAAVGLKGNLWLLSQYKNEDGESYACIRYNVSERTQRIGYALCSDLNLPEITDWHPDKPTEGFAKVDVVAVNDSFLTDDPDVSQYCQFKVSRGTFFTCMGLYNDSYAYVAAEVKKDRFVDGGAVVWGFVPIRDLAPMPQDKADDAKNRLVGKWKYTAGSAMADNFLVFNVDETFTAGIWDWELDTPQRVWIAADMSGTWSVTVNNPASNLYWNKPPYQLTMMYNSGYVIVVGLDFDGTGFTLTDSEGGRVYEPATDEEVRLTDG